MPKAESSSETVALQTAKAGGGWIHICENSSLTSSLQYNITFSILYLQHLTHSSALTCPLWQSCYLGILHLHNWLVLI